MNTKLIEEISMNAWSPLQTKLYNGWVLRFADGYTKRANSVSPLYESKINLDEQIDYCERQYGFCNLPTIFKLAKESIPEGIDKRL
jgi:N-acetylglutamate synthase